MQDLTISIIQSKLIWENIDANLENFEKKINGIKKHQDLIVLPEMFNTGFSINPQKFAETLDGKTMQWLKKQAALKNCVILGSIAIRENDNYLNRLVWMQADGTYQTYDKRHLFRMGSEQIVYAGGDRKIITELKGWKILPLVCYDLRFPVWSKNTYSNNSYEYDLLIYIANWPQSRSHVWKALLKARALENLSYVVGVNRIGKDGRMLDHSGDSTIIDFLGNIVEEAPPSEEKMITYTLNYESLQKFRSGFAVGLDWDDFTINI